MSEFDGELFSTLPTPWRRREGPLCDLKSKVPRVCGSLDELNEFVRDLISFANTARRWGEPAYILFGVDNNGRLLPEGIKGQCTKAQIPIDWDDDDPSKFDRQQYEIIGRQLHQCADEYIVPPLTFDYVASRLPNDTLVSYVEILPNPTPKCFEVKRSSRGGRKPLRRGECWRREGESKVPVSEQEKPSLYSFRDMPYVKIEWWRDHFGRLANEFEMSEWEEKPYLPLFCKCNGGKPRLLRKVVDDFLADSNSHVLLLVGRPGAGKTTFLKLLIGELAKQAATEAMTYAGNQPEQVVPVLFSLDGYARDENNTLAQRVAQQGLDRFGFLRLERAITPERIFKDRTLPFVVCLDALDEMPQTEAESREVQEFIDNHPNLKVIVTCRADALQRRWREKYPVSEIEMLSEEQIAEYLRGRIEDPEGALSFLLSDNDMLHLVRVPLMLEAATEYWHDLEESIRQILMQQIEAGEEILESPSARSKATLGSALESLFLQLFDHESGKSPVSGRDIDAIRHMETLSDLARYMDGRQYQVSHRKLIEILTSETKVQTYRNIGILRRQRTQFAFVNRLVQVYFAAFGYRLLIEDTEEGIEQLCQEIRPDLPFWRKCVAILEDITYRDISPVLALFQS
jgi:energy-coupling factor transporter ATP-binding protein EcfA2